MRFPTRAARQLPTLGNLARMALRGSGTGRDPDGGLLGGPTLQAPMTPFNAPVTPHRRVAWTVLDLERVTAVKRARGTTRQRRGAPRTTGAATG